MSPIAAPSHRSPPRVRAAFRVGIVGHRLNRLPADPTALQMLETRLGEILQAVRTSVEDIAAQDGTLYAPEPARLVAISPLAEGSDRLFASAALDHSYALCTPLPFFKAEFEKDFGAPDGPSVAQFRALLRRAEAHFELDGSRANAAAAYAAAGRLVLNHSDLLVAVWDGGTAQGHGGTAGTVHEALSYHIPVLWVRSQAPFAWSVVQSAVDLHVAPADKPADLTATLAKLIGRELDLPAGEAGAVRHASHGNPAPGSTALATAYFEEVPPSPWRYWFWKSFRNLVGGGGSAIPRPRERDLVRAALIEEGDTGDIELVTHFAWADRLADYYADAHRSNVVLASVLSALAVFLGITPTMLHLDLEAHRFWLVAITALECIVVIALSRSFRRGQRKRWHEKWLEYRMLAEWLRQLRLLAPMGGGRPLLRSRAHLAVYGEPLGSWMYWHVRAIARARALPGAVADRTHIARCIGTVAATIGDARSGQIGFHGATMTRSENIRSRLHRATAVLVRVVIASILLHLAMLITHVEPPEPLTAAFEALVLLCAAFIPALSAALANISNQGEFSRLSKRSRAMGETLRDLARRTTELRATLDQNAASVTLGQVANLASLTAATMLEEVVDWRVVLLDLPQGLE